MMDKYALFILLVYSATVTTTNGYDTPSNPQYHIQTDEGPERYFRYQTLSGQYRKEKRLEDGTVIGSYAWIDDDGMLRQRDYIADNAGYRITKSKNVFVGKNMLVGDAVKAAKKYPSSAGTLVSTKSRPIPVQRPVYKTESIRVTTPVSTTSFAPVSSTGTPCATCNTASSSTPYPNVPYFGSSTLKPDVEISNNALSSFTGSSESSTAKPYVEITPGSLAGGNGGFSTTIAPELDFNSLSSSTGLPLNYLKASPSPFQASSTPKPVDIPAGVQYSPSPYNGLPTYTESGQNSLEYNPYVGQGLFFQNGPTYPIDRNGHTYRGNKRFTDPRIGDKYNKQYPEYDGVSVTNDGFRYYIPRAYHEEETGPGNERTGSFGYIDPFGIRRVIYYNAKPGEGFQHRKNNRYVGFDATPYDPSPY